MRDRDRYEEGLAFILVIGLGAGSVPPRCKGTGGTRNGTLNRKDSKVVVQSYLFYFFRDKYIFLYEEVSCMLKTKWQKKYEKAMDSVEFWRKFYREQYDKTWDKNLEQANEYLGIAIALGDTLRDMKRIAES